MSETIKTVLVDGGYPQALTEEGCRFIYNLLPVGEFYDKRYGRIAITSDKVRQMAENFGKCPSYEVPVKLGHSDGAKSPGKVIDAAAKPEGLEITILVDAETAQAINAKEYRYMSAEYDDDYHDKKTGKKVGAVLLGAALVNQPAHPYVAPLKLAEEIFPDERTEAEMSEIAELKLKLSDMESQLKTLRADAEQKAKEQDAATLKLSELEAENKALKEECMKAEQERNASEVKAFCEKWTEKGIPPVMLEKVKPLLLSEQTKIIKLSEEAKDNINSLKFFDELFSGMPKVPLTQISKTDSQHVELSEAAQAIERGKAIAASIKE